MSQEQDTIAGFPGDRRGSSPDLVVDGVRNTSRLGNIARGAVALALLQAGKCVLLPLNDDQRYDLAVDDGKRFVRVQCKYGRLVNGAVVFKTCSYNSSAPRRNYRGDADYFGVFCGELESCYLVPVSEVPVSEGRLRVTPSRNNQTLRIRWANDYLIP